MTRTGDRSRAARVVLRADGGQDIGAGHVMRMLSLARALDGRAAVTLATACSPAALLDQVRRVGVDVAELPVRHPDGRDLAAIVELVAGAERPWAVVDGYHFDAPYLAGLRQAGFRVMVVDDTPRLELYDVDMLLDQNPGALRKPYVTTGRTLFGPQFMLLRPEVIEAASARDQARDRPTRVTVTIGDADVSGVTAMVVRALRSIANIETCVVVGASNSRAPQIVEEFGSDPSVRVITHTPNLPALFAVSDLVVAGVGITLWEAAYIGAPTLAISSTAVQRQVASVAAEYGAHQWIGDVSELDSGRIRAAVVSLIDDEPRRREMTRLGRLLVDGCGATRVAAAMFAAPQEWRVRPAAAADVEPIWEIASEPGVRSMAFATESFPFARHETWLEARLASTRSRLWVAERDGTVGGFVRYDRDEECAYINIAVAPFARGRGIGAMLLTETAHQAGRTLGVKSVRGVVFAENVASQRIFAKASFAPIGIETRGNRSCVVFEAATSQAV